MPFAQLVIGPPGSGKSTYCDGMQQFMTAVERPCSVVNLDPANDHTSYPAALDVRDLVTLDEIMEAEELGPNGGVLYALEELEHNLEWLEEGLKKLGDEYILFDCPGQVELFTHHASLRNIFFRLQKLGYRLIVIHLLDSYVLTLPTLYISSLLLSLRTMLQLDLPHLNVLTKIDNLHNYPPLPLPLEFYTEASGLEYLLPHLEDEMAKHPLPEPASAVTSQPTNSSRNMRTITPSKDTSYAPTTGRFTALNSAIIDLVDEFSLVGFSTLCVEDRASMTALLHAADRASGHVFSAGGTAGAAPGDVWRTAVREAPVAMEARDVEERWVTRREEFDDIERKEWEAEGKAEREAVKREANPTAGLAKDRRDQGAQSLGDDEDEDAMIAQMSQAMGRDSGIKVVRKGPS